MDISIYEDPACLWCWAFEPVATRMIFELGPQLRLRHVMGGLRDREVVDKDFAAHQWRKAASVTGMPFQEEVWSRHSLRSTFPSCKAVKSASILGLEASTRLLRRLREAYFIEGTAIDDLSLILDLGDELGLPRDTLLESLASGRADALFARDREEASHQGFGFPTLILRSGREHMPVVLQGVVPYGELLGALASLGLDIEARRRFRGTAADWQRLFAIHPRLTAAEILSVTGMRPTCLAERLASVGIEERGTLFQPRDPRARFEAENHALIASLEAERMEDRDSEIDELGAADGPPVEDDVDAGRDAESVVDLAAEVLRVDAAPGEPLSSREAL